MKNNFIIIVLLVFFSSCKKNEHGTTAVPGNFFLTSIQIDNKALTGMLYNVSIEPAIKISFSEPIDQSTVSNNIILKNNSNVLVPVQYVFLNNDSIVLVEPTSPLGHLTNYSVQLLPALSSNSQINFNSTNTSHFITSIDSTDKFPQIADTALLTLVQKQTFKYFWDFGHPVSGLARERNSSGDLTTTGGTGFGIMSIPVAINRNFISRAEGLTRLQLIVNFYKNNCTAYHGAFAHWINGATGATIPFSSADDGADIVETSYLMEGLIVARQYFNSLTNTGEIDLRQKINELLDAVEWNWFRQNNQDVLYWNWSPDQGFVINAKIRGWNEALITYIMAASSTTNPIPATVYSNGWAGNGSMINNNTYYSYQLPLGPPNGGPLFFEHYSFLGIDPNGLMDTYADYHTQTVNHTKINYEYCKTNPHGWNGYSELCWGLTASDVPGGYNANEPNNDPGVISPTAALSSMPYTPAESMAALKFFYYKLGDHLWGPYGFYDAFKLSDPWFANSTLAIDQGPIIVMIENYRSSMVWELFTSAPEIKAGMISLGFSAPYL